MQKILLYYIFIFVDDNKLYMILSGLSLVCCLGLQFLSPYQYNITLWIFSFRLFFKTRVCFFKETSCLFSAAEVFIGI